MLLPKKKKKKKRKKWLKCLLLRNLDKGKGKRTKGEI